MKPNLSLEGIASALAVLGASAALVACGGEDKSANAPVNSTEVSSGGTKPADGHCGADKTHPAGATACGAKPATTATPASTGGAGSCGAKPAGGAGSCGAKPAGGAGSCGAKPAGSTATVPTTAPTTPAVTPPKPAGTAKPAGKSGAGSCGAGTCSAKK